MMAVFFILTMAVFAQNNSFTTQQFQPARSKKELMKMEVMKIQNDPIISDKKLINTEGSPILSIKEQMKTGVMKLEPVAQYYVVGTNGSAKCTPCIKFGNLSVKEQMKIRVVGLDVHPASVDTTGLEANLCSICKMDISTSN